MTLYKEQLVLGLMSGTSMDGLDIALCRFYELNGRISFELVASETIKYPYYLSEKLSDALHLSPQDLHALDQELGNFFANQTLAFNRKTGLMPDIISSHGHTILHQPDKGITLQIGDGDVIAQITRIKVISDFRIQDVSKGGQGAPLVPIGDRDLFPEYDFCLNLGGIANISFDKNGKRVACDISPCNMALNTVTSWIKVEYDNKGKLAAKGKINEDLLLRLNALSYYNLEAPKSLGKEWFMHKFLPEIRKTKISIEDALRTINEHIADQISFFINSNSEDNSTILISGGGAYNNFLIQLIREKTNIVIHIPSKEIIEFKEAIIFAYLGFLRLSNKINVLSSVTGASSDTSAGVINNPNK